MYKKLIHLYPQLKTDLAQNPGRSVTLVSMCAGWCFADKSRPVYLVLRGFAAVHSSGIWCNRLVFFIVMVNPSPEKVEIEWQ